MISIQALVSEDVAQLLKLVDTRVTFDDTDAVAAANAKAGTHVLAPSASDIAVDFGGGVVVAHTVLIIAYDLVTVKLNGTGNSAVEVEPVAAVDEDPVSVYQKVEQPGVVLWRGNITSIHLGNPSGSESARVFVAVVGGAT